MITIAHVTDPHLDEPAPAGLRFDADERWGIVLADLARRGVAEIVFGGDIGAKSAHDRFFPALAQVGVPLRLVLGNHDRAAEVKAQYAVTAGEDGIYSAASISDRPHALFLDSSTGEIPPSQLRWLDNELRTARDVLIFVHHPVLPIETAIDDLYPMSNRDAVRTRLLAHRFPVVVCCGHYHMADDRAEGNVRQLVTPAVSFQVRKESRRTLALDATTFGYRLIHLGDRELTTEIVSFTAAASEGDENPTAGSGAARLT